MRHHADDIEINDPDTHQAIQLESCASLDGSVGRLQVGRRNGKPYLISAVSDTELAANFGQVSTRGFLGLCRALYDNLTPLQRRIWHDLLRGQSIESIASDSGKKRSAVYDAIGRMRRRNKACDLWWRLKKHKNQYE